MNKDCGIYFTISSEHIIMRNKNNESAKETICCKKCMIKLKKAIIEFEKVGKND